MKKIIPAILTLLLVLGSFSSAFACTGVYVGSGVTENGSSYFGRSEDIGDRYGKVFSVAEPKTITDETVFKDTYGFSMKYSDLDFDYPEKTYTYTYVRDSYNYGETMKDADGNYVGEAYAEVGQNEKGVAMTATVSTKYNSKAKAADPLKGDGICEVSMTSILLGGAATAREAVELLAEVIDKYGAGECNSLMIGDANEIWYFEIVSGHQYAAVKLPADKVSVQPNIMLLGVIDVTDTENVIASENLISMPQENEFLVTDESGKIDVLKTYGTASGSSKRYWQGLFYFNEEAANAIDPTSTFDYNLLFDTTKNLSTLDVLNLLAFRGEGSAWDYSGKANLGNGNVIGTRSQSECHIFEQRQNMPTELATIQWQAMADAEFSIYIPYYSALVTETSELYHTEVVPKSVDLLNGDTEGQINTNFHLINYLCDMNRETDPECGNAVKAYFEVYQQSLIDQQVAVDQVMKEIYAHDPMMAKVAATALGKNLAEQASAVSSVVLAELRAYFAEEEHSAAFTLDDSITSVMPVYAVDETYLPTHDFATSYDAEGHWNVCNVCGNTTEAKAHEYQFASDENGHWEVCSACEYETEKVAHEFVDGICVCDAVKKLETPTNVKVSNVAKTGKVKVTWDAVEDAEEYVVYRATSKNGSYKKMITTTGTSYTNTSAKAGTKYYYKVKAMTDDKVVENSKFSKVVSKTCDYARPAVTATAGKKQVKLTWKKVDSAKKYYVYRATSENGTYKKIATTTKLSYTNKDLKAKTTYFYKVKAAGAENATSAYSVVDKCKTKA